MDFELNEEQKMFQTMVRDFVDNEIAPHAAEWDETEKFPYDVVKMMAEVGLYGLHLPEEYGGSGDDISYVLAVEEISRGSAGLGSSYVTTMSLAMTPIMMNGTDEQKARYIPMVVGGATASFGLTEAMAGSDVANLDTKYERDGDDFILNGTKIFITNGSEADFIVTFATSDKSLGYKGISAFIIDKDTPGFSVGKREKKMGQHPASATELIFDNCRVPARNLLGQEGRGFAIALQAIDTCRVCVAAQGVGIAQAAYDAAVAYAKERKQFGVEIARHQGIQFMIADMAVDLDAARLLTYRAAWQVQTTGKVSAKEPAMAKLFASEAAHRICHKAIQIHGGYGYTREFPVERYYRDQRIIEIYEGTSEMQRWTIARQITSTK
ncbi:MAG: acyl-CoA dehydrogenase family protein [Dehalococcoidia bacterium]|nr:acyl-CoA dehydrogenase family protein [Dehalococcoidia bacterium]